MSGKTHNVSIIYGDGIGPEVVSATRKIIDASGVKIHWEECEAGAEVFKKGLPSGVPAETIESIKRNRVVLKGPLETPVGFGEKSANVTLRKLFETYANIRPVREFPGVPSPYSGRGVDLVIVRENVEDLYAGIEHMQSPGVAQTLKIISRKGCEKIVRTAFEFARSEGRKTVHCATKANIMKFSEGMLKSAFEEIAKEYPDINAQHIIVDNCAHQLVRFPEKFDVIVTTNMNGDILSDLGSGLIGGLGFAPGANLGNGIAIFEAVHGSAPKYAGKNNINPTAVLLSGVMMLRYLEEFEAANTIEQALLVTLEQGIACRDVKGDNGGAVSTSEFTDAIIKNFGKSSSAWAKRDYRKINMPQVPSAPDLVKAKTHRVAGVDLFVSHTGTPDELGHSLEQLTANSPVKLKIISNRGVKVYPNPGTLPDMIDVFRCRFVTKDDAMSLSQDQVLQLMQAVGTKHPWTHMELLHIYNDKMGYSKAQGED
ncbi:MAG: NADP-dependent isocitrate dehydrogenase [Holosporales bacterium]